MSRSNRWGPVPPGRSANVRMLVSIGMLLILALLIFQARDPRNWTWLTGDEPKRKPVFVEYPVQKGPIDADPEEWAAAAKSFDLIKDRLPKDDNLNAVSKNRFLKWVLRQTPEELYRRKPATESLYELMNHPN